MKKKTNNTKILFIGGVFLLILLGLVTVSIFAETQSNYNCMNGMDPEDQELMMKMHEGQTYEEMKNKMEEHMKGDNMNNHMKNMMGMH